MADEIAAAGYKVVVIGNGSVDQMNAFKQSHPTDVELFTNPSLEAYRRLELTHGFGGWASLKMAGYGIRAMLGGHGQGRTAGSPLQQGGVVAIDTGGDVIFAHRDTTGGDHLSPRDFIAALQN